MWVRQHIPDFCTGFEIHSGTFATLGELLAIEWVHRWTTETPFSQFSLSPCGPDRALLIAEIPDGSHWVVGYVMGNGDEIEKLGLPEWAGPKERLIT